MSRRAVSILVGSRQSYHTFVLLHIPLYFRINAVEPAIPTLATGLAGHPGAEGGSKPVCHLLPPVGSQPTDELAQRGVLLRRPQPFVCPEKLPLRFPPAHLAARGRPARDQRRHLLPIICSLETYK